MKPTAIVTFHTNPYTCGVARFNIALSESLDVPLVTLNDFLSKLYAPQEIANASAIQGNEPYSKVRTKTPMKASSTATHCNLCIFSRKITTPKATLTNGDM